MSNKPKDGGVRVDISAPESPYRTMKDGTPQLQREYAALLEDTRKRVARVTNAASVAGGLLLADATLNWEPGVARNLGLLLTSALVIAPQIIKQINKNDLALLREYQETVSVHVDNEAGEENPDARRKKTRVLNNLNEHDAGPTGETEAGVFLFMCSLKILSSWDILKQPGQELAVVSAALITSLLAMLATFLTRKALRNEQKRFRGEMQTFMRRIPAQTRVSLDSEVGDDHEVERDRGTKGNAAKK